MPSGSAACASGGSIVGDEDVEPTGGQRTRWLGRAVPIGADRERYRDRAENQEEQRPGERVMAPSAHQRDRDGAGGHPARGEDEP